MGDDLYLSLTMLNCYR